MDHHTDKKDRLPFIVRDTIRWMDKEWLPQALADLPQPTRAIIDVYVQMELMLRQPENYDWDAEMLALAQKYKKSQPVIAAFFTNIRAAMRGEDLPALASVTKTPSPRAGECRGEGVPSNIKTFPVKIPRHPQPQDNVLLRWFDNGKEIVQFRRLPNDFRLTMDTLIRRGIPATLWADGKVIGGVECVTTPQNGEKIRRWRGRIGGHIFYAKTDGRGGSHV